MKTCSVLFFGIIILSIITINALDENYLIQSDRLPDASITATLANGHLGYGFSSDRIEMNCVFNGKGTESERARIPNWANIKVDKLYANQLEWIQHYKPLYTVNAEKGVFEWEINFVNLSTKVIQRTYAHRFYNRAIIYELEVYRTNVQDPLEFHLTQSPGPVSDDVNIYIITDNKEWIIMKGMTKSVEDEELQKRVHTFFAIQSDNLKNGKVLKMPRGQNELNYRFILTIDESEDVAKIEARKLMSLSSKTILADHVKEWASFWQSFNVTIVGNLELSQTVNVGIFYMASALPSLNSFQPNGEYCGLSPQGIGRGRNRYGAMLLGRTFHDSECHMMPVAAHFSNKWAQELFKYRENRLNAACINANITGHRGAKYPWTSAYTGLEMLHGNREYVSPEVIIAVKHYLAVTNDKSWLCKNGWPMVREIAEYLTSRVSLNETTGQYHVKRIMTLGSTIIEDDSAYINVAFKIALEFASYVQSSCDEINGINLIWKDIADKMFVPYDSVLDYHPQTSTHNRTEEVTQVDVILLGYPLHYDMKESTRINDLHIYEAVTSDRDSRSCPMNVINFLAINEVEKADKYFRKSYKDYILSEFKVWNTGLSRYVSPSNLHAAFSAFFQSIMNGYGGIRFYYSNGKSTMAIKKGHLLPDTKSFKIHGIYFIGWICDLEIGNSQYSTLDCKNFGGKPIESFFNGETRKLIDTYRVKWETGTVYLQNVN